MAPPHGPLTRPPLGHQPAETVAEPAIRTSGVGPAWLAAWFSRRTDGLNPMSGSWSRTPDRPEGALPRGPTVPATRLREPDCDPNAQIRRRSVAHLVSWCRVDNWSFRSTDETWLSTVLVEISSSRAISL